MNEDIYFFDDDFCVIPKTALQIFNESVCSYFNLLKARIDKFKELERGTIDFKTYFDIILIQIRAMCIENETKKNNHTLQNFFRINGYEKFATEIIEYFNQVMLDGSLKELTLRETIKTTTDRFIAHYDTITGSSTDDLDFEFDSKRTFYRFICEKELSRQDGFLNIFDIFSYLESRVEVVQKDMKIDSNDIAAYMLL